MFSTVRAIALGAVAILAAGCNDNPLDTLPGDLRVTPDAVDYGRVAEQTSLLDEVVATNVGHRAIRVTGLRIEPENGPYSIAGEVPSVDSPWVLDAEQERGIEIRFLPVAAGDALATLYVESDDPDEPSIPVALGGHGVHVQVDLFTQGELVGGLADILFVVDNSGSMSDSQQKLADSFETFINWLVGGQVDYRIAITTTDMLDPAHQGRFQGNPKVLTPTTPNVVAAFQANATVGDEGSGDEQGLIAALAAVTAPLAQVENAGFLRDAARLFVVFVSDENDSSPQSVDHYRNGLLAVKGGDPSKLFVAAIAGPSPFGCFVFPEQADAGPRYEEIVDDTGGLFGSICETNFGTILQDLAFEVVSVQSVFELTEIPDPETIRVTVDGVEQDPAWWIYDEGSNSISFVPPHVPGGGAEVVVTYEVL